jgi:hypothetical protein
MDLCNTTTPRELTDCSDNEGCEKIALEFPQLKDMITSTRTVEDDGDNCTCYGGIVVVK